MEKELENHVIDEEIGQSAEAVSLGDRFNWDSISGDDVDSALEVDTMETMD